MGQQQQRKLPRKVPTLVIQDGNGVGLISRTEYMDRLRDPEADIPKLLGVLMPKNRALIQWEEQPFDPGSEAVRLNKFQAERVFNLVMGNVAFLANKSQKTFLNNFREVVINKLRKRL